MNTKPNLDETLSDAARARDLLTGAVALVSRMEGSAALRRESCAALRSLVGEARAALDAVIDRIERHNVRELERARAEAAGG